MPKKKDDTLVTVEETSFLDTVAAKLPNKDSKKLTEIRDRLATLTEEVSSAQCHHYGIKRHIYFRWRAELEELRSMFDTP